MSEWWGFVAACSLPGALAGGVAGWLVIRPVNAALGWIFRGFNRGFDGLTSGYGWTVGKLLRTNIAVLLAYGGLLILTLIVFKRAADGLHPAAGPGAADRERSTARLDLVGTHQSGGRQDRRHRQAHAGSRAFGFHCRHVVHFAGEQSELRFHVSRLETLRRAAPRRLERYGHHGQAAQAVGGEVPEATALVYGSSPIPGLGTAGGYKFMVEDRGGLGLTQLQSHTEKLVRDLLKTKPIGTAATQFRSNIPQLFLDIDRPKVAALGVALDDVNQTLDMFLGSLYVNSYNAFGRHWQVTAQAEDRFRNSVSDISLFAVRNNNNQMVTLGTLTEPREIGGPISVSATTSTHRPPSTASCIRATARAKR